MIPNNPLDQNPMAPMVKKNWRENPKSKNQFEIKVIPFVSFQP